jgi:hypothetical protein
MNTPLKHDDTHTGCVACLHLRAHGLWDGFSLAHAELLKAGYVEAANALEDRRRKVVNRTVRQISIAYGVDTEALAELMRHHGK